MDGCRWGPRKLRGIRAVLLFSFRLWAFGYELSAMGRRYLGGSWRAAFLWREADGLGSGVALADDERQVLTG